MFALRLFVVLFLAGAFAGQTFAAVPPGCIPLGSDRLFCKKPIAPDCTKSTGLAIGWFCPVPA